MRKTSKGGELKGSKYWIQNFINNPTHVGDFNKEIQEKVPEVEDIEWLSPLQNMDYKEFKTKDIPFDTNLDFTFWPNNGPSWDAIGKDKNGTILLVEAKAHVGETRTKCRATNMHSITLIKKTMKEVHDNYSDKHVYEESEWYDKFYQLGNRLAFLKKLRQQGVPVVLILVNFIGDYTHRPTTDNQWQKHYNTVFPKIFGNDVDYKKEGIVVLNIEIS